MNLREFAAMGGQAPKGISEHHERMFKQAAAARSQALRGAACTDHIAHMKAHFKAAKELDKFNFESRMKKALTRKSDIDKIVIHNLLQHIY